jgi:hypothetical protein
VAQHAEAKNIYQRITLEAFVEINLAADGRDADTVTVMRNTGDDAREQSPVRGDFRFSSWGFRICIRDRPKAQRVQTKLRACAHSKNVADDTAHAGRGALERLDGARMIVTLHFERDCPAIANIDNSGILFAGFDQNVWAGGGKFFQFFPGIFVRAVFAPHDRENSKLGEVRLATEDFFDPL